MNPAERIHRLVQAGTLAPDEGERLLAAMAREPRHAWFWILVNPFDRFGGGVAAVGGAAISALGVLTTRLGLRFDGFLDLHIANAPLSTAVVEQGAGWIVPALLFWGYALVAAKRVRLIDFLGMTGLARLPLLIAALLTALVAPRQPQTSALTLVLLGVAIVPFVVWNITLLYQGFKNASGLRGARLVAGFIVLAIASEIASKLLLLIVT